MCRLSIELRNHNLRVLTLLPEGEGKTTVKHFSELAGWLSGVVDLVHVRMSFVRNSGDPALTPFVDFIKILGGDYHVT